MVLRVLVILGGVAVLGAFGRDEDCLTVKRKRCQFPYLHYDGQMKTECFKRSNSVFKSFCPTEVDPVTKRPDNSSVEECSESCPLTRYHTHEELVGDLNDINRLFPGDTELFNLGDSQLGSQILGIRLSEGVGRRSNRRKREGELLRPMVKMVANMHGNEPVGRELLVHLAKYLLRFQRDILETTDLHILPTMNPDGFDRAFEGRCDGTTYSAGRLSEGKIDLNRDFPKWYHHKTWELADRREDLIFSDRERETKVLMRWILDNAFALSASFHDGARLVSYPWGSWHNDTGYKYTDKEAYMTPDHDEFYRIATAYSFTHPTMKDKPKPNFRNGVTNGANWYPITGGMKDFSYQYTGTMEVVVEVSDCKYPHRSKLLTEWENNREAMLTFIEQAHTGVKGFVTEADGITPPAAGLKGRHVEVRVRRASGPAGRASEIWRSIWSRIDLNREGAYWKILNDGWYDVQAVEWRRAQSAGGEFERDVLRESKIARVQVQNDVKRGAQRLDLRLKNGI